MQVRATNLTRTILLLMAGMVILVFAYQRSTTLQNCLSYNMVMEYLYPGQVAPPVSNTPSISCFVYRLTSVGLLVVMPLAIVFILRTYWREDFVLDSMVSLYSGLFFLQAVVALVIQNFSFYASQVMWHYSCCVLLTVSLLVAHVIYLNTRSMPALRIFPALNLMLFSASFAFYLIYQFR